ncbi:MAG TPA: hypothetical protein VER08_00330 [Pyrinomonadaceae bacterium]|nr:hypothetical protein [Pyrinomonadaceae bacterium]
MRRKTTQRTVFAAGWRALVCLSLLTVPLAAGPALSRAQTSARGETAPTSPSVAAFEERVKQYVKLREDLEDKLPKLSTESTPAQIEAHKTTFQGIVRNARSGAKQGDIFTPDIVTHIRATIGNEYKGRERQQLIETVMEAETQGVPLRVNYPYPESKEFVEMPPTLLLKLPTLPKQVKYRFVGRNMLLVDRENGLIIDYMLNALPTGGR